jgi:hypothetical protein
VDDDAGDRIRLYWNDLVKKVRIGV